MWEKLHLIYQGTPKYQFRKRHLHSVIIPVVGGLLYTLGLYPFMYHGIIGSETDFNTITKMGLYKIYDGTNAPNGPEIGHGLLIYFVSSDNHYKLMLAAKNSGTIKFRTGDSKWRDWKVLIQ